MSSANASILAIREFIDNKKGNKKNVENFKINTKHFKLAREEVKSRIKEGKEKEVTTTKDGKKLMAKMGKEDMRKAGVKPGDIIEADVAKPRE